MSTSLNEVFEFLNIAGSKGFLNDNTVISRRTACNKFFDILDDSQKTVEYVRDNLEIVKSRFSNLNKDVRGNTVNEYARRVSLVLNDFTAWSIDRSAWERDVSARQAPRPANDADKKSRTPKTEKKINPSNTINEDAHHTNSDARIVKFPIRADFEVSVTLPRSGITVAELKKLGYFLLPYAQDWTPTDSSKSDSPMLDRD